MKNMCSLARLASRQVGPDGSMGARAHDMCMNGPMISRLNPCGCDLLLLLYIFACMQKIVLAYFSKQLFSY
jgi:hypothetical protein